MITHFDMASCEMIVEPQPSEEGLGGTAAGEPQAQLRLQTVAEAVAEQAATSMPADLLQADVARFIAAQE